MRIREIMSLNFDVVTPGDTVEEALRFMREHRVGSLPVCDGAELVGVITFRDIAVRSIRGEGDPLTEPVHALMSTHPEYCFDHDDVREVAGTMQREGMRRIPVLDQDCRLVGIVSVDDFASHGLARLAGRLRKAVAPERLKSSLP